jgi:hypothetical protein
MIETISLELAREIAGKYEELGVEAPASELYFMQGNDGKGGPGEWGLRLFFLPAANWCHAYTAAELFEVLPPNIHVWKDESLGRFHCTRLEIRHIPVSAFYEYPEEEGGFYPMTHADTPAEALGKILFQLLGEQIKEKQK